MIVKEKKIFNMFDNSKRVLLIEPRYKKSYPPLGLAKIKSYLKSKNVEVDYSEDILPKKYDLICISTLFTYHSDIVFKILHNRGFFNQNTPILIGGIFASLMPEVFENYNNSSVFVGYSKTLDRCIPDPEIMDNGIDPWDKFSYVFTSRGCPNRCPYCMVWKFEKGHWINKDWKNMVDLSKPNLMISDNNLSALPFENIKDVVDFVVENDKKVIFNNGFDVKLITPEIATQLGRIKYTRRGMRIAFDRIEEDGIFQDSVKLLLDSGIPGSQIMAYVLFNFTDKPQDAYYRAKTCLDLGIQLYPAQYKHLKALNNKNAYIGKHWTRRLSNTFRYYWLMHGINSKMSFEDYIQSKDALNKHKLKKIDINTYLNNGK